jgi:hypothetical protein
VRDDRSSDAIGMHRRRIGPRTFAQTGLCDAQGGRFLRVANTWRTGVVRLAFGERGRPTMRVVPSLRAALPSNKTSFFSMFSFFAMFGSGGVRGDGVLTHVPFAPSAPMAGHDER